MRWRLAGGKPSAVNWAPHITSSQSISNQEVSERNSSCSDAPIDLRKLPAAMRGLEASALLLALAAATAAAWWRAKVTSKKPAAAIRLPSVAAPSKPDTQPQADKQQQPQQEQQIEVQAQQAAAEATKARQRNSPLYTATANETLVHEWLLNGQEGSIPSLPPLEQAGGVQAPAHMASGRAALAGRRILRGSPGASPFPPAIGLEQEPSEMQEVEAELHKMVREAAERAFFDSLADGLRCGDTQRLAALLLDARNQLQALSVGSGGSREGMELAEELQAKLDTDYVRQRLQHYDAQFCAQAFDLLCHTIGRLQAPARRQSMQQAYSEVAALFAAAATAASAADDKPASSPLGVEDSAAEQIQLTMVHKGNQDGTQAGCTDGKDASTTASTAVSASAGKGRLEESMQWQLKLLPDPSGSPAVVAMLSPALAANGEQGTAAAVEATETASAAAGAGMPKGSSSRSSPKTPGSTGLHDLHGSASAMGGASIGEASVTAAVAAARFLLHQLVELRGDVARARLAMLREAVLGGSDGIEYERARYERAVALAAGTASSNSVNASSSASPAASNSADAASISASGGPSAEAVAQVFPITQAWLKRVLQEAPPPRNLQGSAYCRACVGAGLLQLAQLPHALTADMCPEVLLLDLRGIVALQNELQRLCLLASSLLIVQQVLASRKALPPAGSPQHAALCEGVVERMGALLSGGAGMEGLVLELHRQLEAALAQHAQQARQARQAQQEVAQAVSMQGQHPGEGSGLRQGELNGEQQQEQLEKEQQEEQQEDGEGPAEGKPSSIELDVAVVRRMTRQIFSTDNAVYQRVLSGVLASATALLNSASASSGSAGGGSPSASPAWRRTLRGVGAEAVAGGVYRLAAQVYRIAAVSTAVAEPLVYVPLLQQLRQQQQ